MKRRPLRSETGRIIDGSRTLTERSRLLTRSASVARLEPKLPNKRRATALTY